MSEHDNIDQAKQKRLERERTQRREAIISVAEDIFAKQGYSEAMVDEIATEAGYTKATIYNYFDSKDDLYIAVATRAFDKLIEIMDKTLSQPDAVYELRSLGNAYLTFVEECPFYAEIMDSGRLSIAFNAIVEKERTSQPLTECEQELRSRQLRIERLMTDVIAQTLMNSGVQEKVDPLSVTIALSTLGLAIREIIMRGKTGGVPEEKTREYLSVLYTIIDQGLKHYDAK
ncbi:MAG: TetR/AcrR family transcriptional regulator [Promethearchaeota archaeon]